MTAIFSPSWGRSMVHEFAAKQQLLSARHVFTDMLAEADAASLEDLLIAIDAVGADAIDGRLVRSVLVGSGGDRRAEAIALCHALRGYSDAQAGMMLALAYLPVDAVDAAAKAMLRPIALRAMAEAIDPRGSLVLRTRLFVADRMLRQADLPGLIAGVSALAALRANGGEPGWSELLEPRMRQRLLRLRETVAALRQPARFAGSLSACLRGDWAAAERRLVSALGAAEDLPRLADLFTVSLLPTCDTLDAIRQLRAAVSIA